MRAYTQLTREECIISLENRSGDLSVHFVFACRVCTAENEFKPFWMQRQ